MIFKTGLFFHIAGIFLIAGGLVGGALTERLFWKYVQQASEKAKPIVPLLLLFPRVIISGAVIMLISGLLMLYSVHWIFWGQSWLTLKLIFFILLVLNGRLVGKPLFGKIAAAVQSATSNTDTLVSLKKRLNSFHLIQYCMLHIVVALAIFGP
jgi:hypothetical protein